MLHLSPRYPLDRRLGSASSCRLWGAPSRSEEHTSELQSLRHLVCRLLLEKTKTSGDYHFGGFFHFERRHRHEERRHGLPLQARRPDRKSTRLNSSHLGISYAV